MNQLAAALWNDASRLLARLETKGLDVFEGKKIERLVHARMHEAVSLLEQVLREVPRSRLARLRLAYYLRVVDPAAAVEHFQRLLRSPGPGRRQVRRDLAGLLVSLARFAAAAELVDRRPTEPGDCLLSFTVAWMTRDFTWAAELFSCAALAMSPGERIETWAHLASVQAKPASWYERSARGGVNPQAAVGKALRLLVGMGRLEEAGRLAKAAAVDHVVSPQAHSCQFVLSRLAGYCAFSAGPQTMDNVVEVTWQPRCQVKGADRAFRRCLCHAGKWCRRTGCAARFLLRFGKDAPLRARPGKTGLAR